MRYRFDAIDKNGNESSDLGTAIRWAQGNSFYGELDCSKVIAACARRAMSNAIKYWPKCEDVVALYLLGNKHTPAMDVMKHTVYRGGADEPCSIDDLYRHALYHCLVTDLHFATTLNRLSAYVEMCDALAAAVAQSYCDIMFLGLPRDDKSMLIYNCISKYIYAASMRVLLEALTPILDEHARNKEAAAKNPQTA